MKVESTEAVEELDVKIGKKRYVTDSTDLPELAQQVIDEKQLDVYPAKIGYVLVYPYITKTTAGRCIRTGNELKLYSGYDFIIEMSGELWDKLDDKTKYVLMYHELMHILVDYNNKKGEYVFKIYDHDVQDFSKLIKEYGIDWFTDLRTMAESVHNVEHIELLKV